MQLQIIVENNNNPLLLKTTINSPIYVDESYLRNNLLCIYVNKHVFIDNPNKIINYINEHYLSKKDYEKLFLDSSFLEEKIIKQLNFKNIKHLEFSNSKIKLDNKIYKYLENISKIYINEVSNELEKKYNLYHNGIVDLKSDLIYNKPTYKKLKEKNYIVINSPITNNNLNDLQLLFNINPNIKEVYFSFDKPNEYINSIDKILDLTSNISNIKLKNNISSNNLEIFKTIKDKYKDKNILFEISYTKELNAKHSKENDTICTLDEYINMEEILNIYIDSIKKHNYSTFEQVIYAYDIAKSYEYIMENFDEDPQISRQLHSAIFGEKIVCVGFASIFNSLLSKLNIPCANYGTFVYEDNQFEGHERSIIYLKDDKYYIDGIFVCDPTWDRRRDNDINPLERYTYFMINPNDVTNFKLNEDMNGVSIIKYFKNNLKYDYSSLKDFIEIHDKLFNTCYSDDSNVDKYIEHYLDKSKSRITYSQLLKGIIEIRKKEGIYNSHEEIKHRIKELIEINKQRESTEYKKNSEIISKKNKRILEFEKSEKIYRFTKKHF